MSQSHTPGGRLASIDMARGAVMVLMALDHVRWFFTNISSYQPETLAQTDLALFLTRWVTHFCAPGFFLLAGIGIFLHGAKIGDKAQLARFLVGRGLLLVALELTIVGYAWVFTPGNSFAGVIWSLGWSMVIMAGFIYLPRVVSLGTGMAILLFHNGLLDCANLPEGAWAKAVFRLLYAPGPTDIPGIVDGYFTLFPIIPWLAMMLLGYSLGAIYLRGLSYRSKVLAGIGAGMIVAFVVLRIGNIYGNPASLWISPDTSGWFSVEQGFSKSIISFLNTEKYPPSLQYSLMTLGPIFLWLGLTRIDVAGTAMQAWQRVLVLFGRVPLFYYVVHLYLIHLLALTVASVFGQPVTWIGFGADPNASRDAGFGFDLWVVHLMWVVTVAILYAACRWYADYKRRNNYFWLKYF